MGDSLEVTQVHLKTAVDVEFMDDTDEYNTSFLADVVRTYTA